ncbi:hypothetical protein EVAR_68928_1 [Eumeta japonica]|uniref:Uncharacterized protein n=1 Tax=Eumeta variegata TaxID=151549 RepID=A0A4C2ACD8_EUMVA|nr:hypothetical protein EVAR_68928_1 [Eumeta japonica]
MVKYALMAEPRGSAQTRCASGATCVVNLGHRMCFLRGALNCAWNSYGVETLTKRILLYVTNHYVYVLCSDEGTKRPCHNVYID